MRRWARFLTLAPGPAAVAGAAGAAALIGLVLAGVYGLSQTGRFLENFGFFFGVLCAPAVVLALAAAAVWERQALPRAGLWLATAVALVAGGLFAAAGLAASPEAGLASGAATYLIFCVAPAAICAAIGLFFAARGLPAARAALDQARSARALAILEARGEATLTELAAELDAPAEACAALVDELLRGGRLAGFFDTPHGRIYTATALRAKQTQLAAVVHARGQVTFDELAGELNAPRELLRQWVYELVRRGEFTGYLNWTEGRLYSAEAQQLGSDRCPHCGGELALAGQGVIQCANCGAEIFRA